MQKISPPGLYITRIPLSSLRSGNPVPVILLAQRPTAPRPRHSITSLQRTAF